MVADMDSRFWEIDEVLCALSHLSSEDQSRGQTKTKNPFGKLEQNDACFSRTERAHCRFSWQADSAGVHEVTPS